MDHEVAIVGAGFGGMGATIQLNRLGIDDIVILEREDDLGGTWHVNHYPGLAVDIASVTYSYSFEPNPYWSHLYAPGAELKRYAEHVADKYDLRRYMRFGVHVDGARWDDDEQVWTVLLRGGETLTARYLVTATGFLSQPRLPDIPGIDTFTGRIIHTAKWDDDYDPTDDRVAVIGTGATAVQLIPQLAKKVRALTVYQRTPIWVVPKVNPPIPKPVQQLFARVPLTQRAARLASTAALESLMVFGVVKYRQTGVLNVIPTQLGKAHLRRQVKDRELRRKLTPDYTFGCKRPTFANDYFPAFTKPHVQLETTSISHIEPDGIVTADGRKTEIDTLVCATGYNIWDANFPAFEIIGRDGRDLGKWWRETRFQAYEGITMPKFPNLLCLNSPYSYSGLSYFTTVEAQMKHIDRLFRELRRRGVTTFEVRPEANDAFLARMTEQVGDSVFYRGSCATANSYYFNQHGEATLLRPNSTIATHREARRFPLDDYAYA